jgi:TrmH family RNA methyltransferase
MLSKSKVKYIQSLSHKKQRDKDAVFVAEGPKIVKELLEEKNIKLKELLATAEFLNRHPELMLNTEGVVQEISGQELEKISFLTTPKEVLGIFSHPEFPPFQQPVGITLILDTIQDPGNMGTIIRCADWFGVKHIICTKDSADVFNPKVVQSTMGSIARVQVMSGNPLETLEQFPDIPVFAATLDGKPIGEISISENCFLIIGNESKGISKELLQKVTMQVTIPGKGKAESLNAAVATGIFLSWLSR